MGNVILEGIDAAGKTTLAQKLRDKYNMKIINSTSKTRNTFEYHLDLLDYQQNTVFDRFHFGEMIYPHIYNREGKLTDEDFDYLNQRIIDNNDLLIVFTCSDMNIINERLKARGEEEFIPIMEKQNELFEQEAHKFLDKYGYKNFYIIDVARPHAYEHLDNWIDQHINKITTNIAYRQLARDLLDKGHVMETRNIRGNTKELCNYSFTITDLDTEYISLRTGKSDLTYLAAELLWYWSARNDTEFIGKFASLWNKLSDDGKTNNSAYGYILQKKFKFNQIEKIIELLKVDQYSRRAVLNINTPNENVIETKDEPCTVCLDYQIRNGKLNCTCVMRSNDMNFGLRNDLGFFISLQKYIAKRLGIYAGEYTHFAMSIHFYDKDVKFVKDVAYGDLEASKQKLDIEKLLDNKDYLVKYIDKKFTTKEAFTELLKTLDIIKE